MNIEISTDEASLLVGIIAIWMANIPHTSEEHVTASRIVDRIFAEDKKEVDRVLEVGK